jgi:hypothetical protein
MKGFNWLSVLKIRTLLLTSFCIISILVAVSGLLGTTVLLVCAALLGPIAGILIAVNIEGRLERARNCLGQLAVGNHCEKSFVIKKIWLVPWRGSPRGIPTSK